jgi:heme exporter protein D
MNLYWGSVAEFLAMGGYGLYVWGSFGATALVIAAELWSLRLRRKALSTEIDE